ncbi:MAG: AAA family ATPase [Alphaproteobacteria bacterium]|nr:AAA family ATPase [Alphaproteobacteria bacterium]
MAMLIEFAVSNFRSFKSRQALSMVAGNVHEHLETNTFTAGLPGFGRFLRTSVIYGPNAAGKTNLLRAFAFVQNLIVNSASMPPSAPLPYTPFKLANSMREAPSEFAITFVQNGIRYEYSIAMDAARIHQERLVEYANPRGRTLFDRRYDEAGETYQWKFSSFLKGQPSIWRDATRSNALFLSTAVLLNSEQLLPVFEWFQKRLAIIFNTATLNPGLMVQLYDQPEGREKILGFLHEADLGIADIGIKRQPMPDTFALRMALGPPPRTFYEQRLGDSKLSELKITLFHLGEDGELVGLDIDDESAGTQALCLTAGAWLKVFENGEVLLFDEIDTSLHPMLTKFLIKKFHSSAINQNNSQLIFSTHNTTFLDNELFRRDQIWFVEKDQNGASGIYPLSDFNPRNDENFERWYLRGKYGALPILNENNS